MRITSDPPKTVAQPSWERLGWRAICDYCSWKSGLRSWAGVNLECWTHEKEFHEPPALFGESA